MNFQKNNFFALLNQIQGCDNYRHEYKYIINPYQLEDLRLRLPTIMQSDAHTDSGGEYQIRSLYFDDYENSSFYDKENGTDSREKFRIRIYNGSADVIKLELKKKERGKTLKKACSLTKEQAEQIISGNGVIWDDGMPPLLKKFYVLQKTVNLQPKVIVEYDRAPFVCENGNVRVTLDLNLRTTADINRFFDKQTNCALILPTGTNLLEVKFDEFLPDYIYQTVQLNNLQQTSFSKFYLCRQFGGILI
ncbi:MAG: polyphosphate polymerase domain-containing protein [Eubacterium sp.]|nr:polyphosphate polymerase domain-containing protein [Eubacterium sp.]